MSNSLKSRPADFTGESPHEGRRGYPGGSRRGAERARFPVRRTGRAQPRSGADFPRWGKFASSGGMSPSPWKATTTRCLERFQEFPRALGRTGARLPLELVEGDAAAGTDPYAFAEELPALLFESLPARERYPAAAVDDAMPGKPGRFRTGMEDARDLSRPARIPGKRGDLPISSHFPPGDGSDAPLDPLFEFHRRSAHYK